MTTETNLKIIELKKKQACYENFHNIKACTVHMLCIVCFVE